MSRRILPHEAVFGLFLVVTWARFVAVIGPFSPEAMLYLGCLALDVALIAACERQPSRGRWLLRLAFHPVAMNVLFMHMKGAIPKLSPFRLDASLQHLDRLLVGTNLSLRLESHIHPALTEALSFCYLLFFPYLLFSLVWIYRRDLRTLRAFHVGLFTVYGLGFLGYSFVPAWGPWIAMADAFHTPLTGWAFTHWNDAVVRAGSNGVDVFPSLHCAVSAFLLGFDARHSRWRFWLYLVPCVGLWGSTLYLRYHYAVDLLAGFALAALALAGSRHFEKKDNRCP